MDEDICCLMLTLSMDVAVPTKNLASLESIYIEWIIFYTLIIFILWKKGKTKLVAE